jgi:4-hydroxy-tetrahydrodipicolinate reductase
VNSRQGVAGGGIAVLGISGRMGQALVRALQEPTAQALGLRLSGALASSGSPFLGQDAGAPSQAPVTGIAITADRAQALAGAAVAIDFTLPAALHDNLAACVAVGVPVVVGTTGLDLPAENAMATAAFLIPVLHAPNMSLGVNLLLELVAQAAAALPADYDIEIFEAHHKQKLDAPSGTAVRLGQVAANARGSSLAASAVYVREGQTGARPPGAIGFATVRAGDIVGEHTVLFCGTGERLELGHRATDRLTFARGALRAAQWLAAESGPGLYSMRDVLGLGR